jgi:hypothetical protein
LNGDAELQTVVEAFCPAFAGALTVTVTVALALEQGGVPTTVYV